jgi:Flp pilus assembly protein TadG
MTTGKTFRSIALRLHILADRFAREARGVAAVEFAFVAPIMLLLFVGTIELSAGVSTNRKLSRLSSTIGDLVTQSQSLTQNDLNNIMDVSEKVMYPYSDGVIMILTGIEIANNQAKVK